MHAAGDGNTAAHWRVFLAFVQYGATACRVTTDFKTAKRAVVLCAAATVPRLLSCNNTASIGQSRRRGKRTVGGTISLS